VTRSQKRAAEAAQAEVVRTMVMLALALLLAASISAGPPGQEEWGSLDERSLLIAMTPFGAGGSRRRADWGPDHRARRYCIYSRRQARAADFMSANRNDPPDPPFLVVVVVAIATAIGGLWGYRAALERLGETFLA